MKDPNKKLRVDRIDVDLAVKRTKMSCERSLLSYIRTACVFVSLAFTYLKIGYEKIDTFVIIMFIIGFGFLVFGMVEYFLTIHRTNNIYKEYENDFFEPKEDLTSDHEI
ncbi:MAG: DUF202 domain-containing protein [Clostridia bacterium]|nr:DUF202 domain-containing protein [Clostridia bacterium]